MKAKHVKLDRDFSLDRAEQAASGLHIENDPHEAANQSSQVGPNIPTCEPGSIEQQLDMCEVSGPRGDDIIRRNDFIPEEIGGFAGFHDDMSESNREGDEESGDDHSSGLQGIETEISGNERIDPLAPGGADPEQEIPRINRKGQAA